MLSAAHRGRLRRSNAPSLTLLCSAAALLAASMGDPLSCELGNRVRKVPQTFQHELSNQHKRPLARPRRVFTVKCKIFDFIPCNVVICARKIDAQRPGHSSVRDRVRPYGPQRTVRNETRLGSLLDLLLEYPLTLVESCMCWNSI